MPRRKASADQSAEHTKASTASKAQDGKKRGPGQPRKIKDAEHLARVVDDYINYNISCNTGDNIKLPTDYDFCKFAGIGISTYYQYQEDKDTYKGYTEALKKLTAYRESYFSELSIRNPKASGAAIFQLKQRKNGGYADKPLISVEARELKIVHGQSISDDSFK
jgi:hypothetical protein